MGSIIKHLFFATAALFLFNNCSKEVKINTLPPDVIASWINIEGATKKSGDLPLSPSVDAPVILTDRNNVGAVPQSNMFLSFKSDKPVAGVYLKVKGSSSYMDIPIDKLHSTFVRMAANQQVGISTDKGDLSMYLRPGQINGIDTILNVIMMGMSSSSEPQTFCIEYCVHDEEGNTSNVIEVCVQVQSWGGNGNILNTWKYEGMTVYQNYELYSEFQEPWGGDFYDICSDIDNGYGDVEFDVKVYRSMEFKSDGTFVTDFKNVPYPGQLYIYCDDDAYYNHLKHKIFYGQWAFDPLNKLVFFISNRWEDNPHAPPQYQEFDIYMSSDFQWLFTPGNFHIFNYEFPTTSALSFYQEVFDYEFYGRVDLNFNK